MAKFTPNAKSSTSVTLPITIDESYDQSYTQRSEWRELGAKYKAQNIIDICEKEGCTPRKVLEVGCGEGSILMHLDQKKIFKDLYALEIASSGIQLTESRNLESLVEVKQFNGYDIPYPDNSFDLVILSHVLEHVEYERALLREIRRVAPLLVIEVPIDYEHRMDDRAEYFFNYGHINVYLPTLLRFLLRSEGYIILQELLCLTDDEVFEYSHFTLGNVEKTPEALAAFREERQKAREQFEGADEFVKEVLASSCTLLCIRDSSRK